MKLLGSGRVTLTLFPVTTYRFTTPFQVVFVVIVAVAFGPWKMEELALMFPLKVAKELNEAPPPWTMVPAVVVFEPAALMLVNAPLFRAQPPVPDIV